MYWSSPYIWVCPKCAALVGLLDPATLKQEKQPARCNTCYAVTGLIRLRVKDIQRNVKEMKRTTGNKIEKIAFDPKLTLKQVPPKPNFKFSGGTWQACPRTTARLKRASNARI